VRNYKLALTTASLAVLVLTALNPLPAKAADGTPLWNWNARKCLGVLGGNMTNGTPVVQWTCNGNPDQQWQVTVGGAWAQIRNIQNPGKCLGVINSTTYNGSNLVIWDCNGNLDQSWALQFHTVASPIECFNIYNENAWLAALFVLGASPKVVGILGADPGDGAQAVLWDYLGNPDQTWCTNFELISP